jgi:hypothetical protein
VLGAHRLELRLVLPVDLARSSTSVTMGGKKL